ncbi:hypothetical protein ACFLIM_06000 [Nonomuraea sp. M3C6]|uniref:Small secreted hydrophilic protein n=1 Tax=Nonomuraea marmarensis TaxID=3351344 RepID=A0ABW7A5W9_9ACTN
MKHRGTMILLVLGVAVAGFMSVGLVRAADDGPDLGEPVVVERVPGERVTSTPASTASPSASTGNDGEPSPTKSASERPSPRKTKAEPVKPPSPRPGGGDDDDADDDDGGGGDGDD